MKNTVYKNKLWLILGLFLIVLVPSYLAWRTLEFWKIKEGIIMISLVSIGYLLSYGIISRLIVFPRVEHTGVILTVISLTFLLIICTLALGRVYYSRSFLVLAYILNTTWFLTGSFSRRKKKLKFAILPSDKDSELFKEKELSCFILDEPCENPNIDGLIIPSTEDLPPEWEQYIVNQMLKGVPVYTTYSIYEDVLGKIPIKYFYGRFAETQVQSTIFKVLKRISDVLLIVIASPLILLIVVIVSILIKLDSDGPVFFKQERVGQGGKVFKIVKFRTMYSDAEIDGPKFSNKNDPRVTRVGRFLRKFHLDEIPQFWNVLKGDMSLIGPRPEQVEFVREFEKKIPYYNLRHLVKPGITGWAQVQYGYAASLDETVEKLEYDLFYIKNPSIWLDLAIAIKTLRILILLER